MKKLELKVSPPIQITLTAILMWVVSRFDIFPFPLSLAWRSVVFVLILIATGSVLTFGVWQYRKARTTWLPNDPSQTTALVTDGIYRFSRNPMYLCWTIILIGWSIFLGSGLSLLLVPVFMASITRFQIIPEERALEELFGENFRAYKQKVRRWI